SLAVFRDLSTALDEKDADSGFVNTGYLILARDENAAQLRANLALQRGQGASTYEISEADARKLHPLLNAADVAVIGYEPDSGSADPHLTITSFARAATRRGAQIRSRTPVTDLIVEGTTVRG